MERRNERQTQRLTGSKIERWRETSKERETERDQKKLVQRDGEADPEREKQSRELERTCQRQRYRETD